MKLISLHLKNIRSYTDQTIEFPEGSLLLSGDIGSGKSTILLAIEFALFGVKKKYFSAQSLLRLGKNHGAVTLHFELDNKSIIINRTLKRMANSIKQDAGFVSIDGHQIEGTAIELKARVLDLLSYPKESITKSDDMIYRYSTYTAQEDMKEILSLSQEERLNTLRKLFGIDKYKKIKENCQIILKDLRMKKKINLAKTEDLPLLLNKEKEQNLRKKQLDKEYTHAQEELDKILEKLKIREEELHTLLKQKEELVQLTQSIKLQEQRIFLETKQLQVLQDEIKETQKEISTLNATFQQIILPEQKISESNIKEQIHALELKIAKQKEHQITLHEQLKHNTAKLQELSKIDDTKILDEKIQELHKKQTEIESTIKEEPELKEQLSMTHKDLKLIQQKLAGIATLEKQINTQEENLKKLDSCPMCLQHVGDDHKHQVHTHHAEKLSKLSQDKKNFQEEEQTLNQTIKHTEKKIEHIQEIKIKHETIKGKLNELHHRLKELTQQETVKHKLMKENQDIELKIKELQPLEKQHETLLSLKEELEKTHKLELLKEKKNSLAIQIKNHEKTLVIKTQKEKEIVNEVAKIKETLLEHKEKAKNNSFNEKEYEDITFKVNKLNEFKQERSITISNIRKEVELIDKEHTEITVQITKKQELVTQTKSIDEKEQFISDTFLQLTSTIERNLMANIYQEFNGLFTAWFFTLVDSSNFECNLDDTFTPIIRQNGHEIEINNLSGGERTAVALSYRLALNKVVNDLIPDIKTKNIIILDEPTDGFSSEQLDKVRDILDELSIGQTIIVSHDPKIESFVDNVIRIHKYEHISTIDN